MNAYRKGYRGESELARELTDLLGVPVRRGAVPMLPGFLAPDVYGLPGIHIETKRRDRLSLAAAMRQARWDAGTALAVVISRGNHQEWLVTCRLADWLKLSQQLCQTQNG